ncbi:MAG: cytochrome c3 family protein [Deltaproteobacteria bacterium]|nr:cytochrome c3 family protein [Deltaproteobacteria bacterium]
MRTIHLAVACLALLFLLSLTQGCGEDEKSPQQKASPLSEPQTKEERIKSPSVEEIAEIPPPVPLVEMEVDEETESVTEPVIEAEGSGSIVEIIIENKGYMNDKKKPVKLNHKKHSEEYEIACDHCHHLYQDGTNVWKEGDSVQKCAACHDPMGDDANVMKLQSAFHKNCRDCHKEMSEEGREAPYKKCGDCHS